MKYWFYILVFSLVTAGAVGADDHDHERGKAPPSRPSTGKGGGPATEGCQANPSRLADFANGEKYDFNSVVTFITNPICAGVHAQVSRAAIAEGVSFNKSGPFRLDQHAKSVTQGPSGTASSVDQILGKTIPQTLTENPLSSSELLPLLGQLALLSPSAARSTLTTLIRQETESADQKLAVAKADLKPAIAADLAVSLLRMGVLDPVVASDLGEAVEEMALTVQADSLARFFRGLAAAATADATLAPTFNQSASALNRGVQNGNQTLTDDQQARLLQAVFEAVRSSVSGTGLLEPGSAELNEAVQTLVEGKPLTLTSLRKLWREATRLLAASPTQPALAGAVAASLTPQMVFLRPDARDLLLSAAANYPNLATAVQQNFVYAWLKAWNRMSQGDMTVRNFNRLKVQYFEPMVPRVLDFPADAIDIAWLRAANRWGLIKDQDVEKKFPRLFLAQLEKRDRSVKAALADDSPENTMKALSDSFAVLWALHQVHLPVLNRWVKKHEE